MLALSSALAEGLSAIMFMAPIVPPLAGKTIPRTHMAFFTRASWVMLEVVIRNQGAVYMLTIHHSFVCP